MWGSLAGWIGWRPSAGRNSYVRIAIGPQTNLGPPFGDPYPTQRSVTEWIGEGRFSTYFLEPLPSNLYSRSPSRCGIPSAEHVQNGRKIGGEEGVWRHFLWPK